MPALKGKGSIKFGINKVKENTTFVCEDSANLWNEYYEYKWRLDADKCPTDDPIDKFNHLMDAYRYAELAKGVYY